MANLLDVLRDLVEAPDNRAAYLADSASYLRSNGVGDLTGEDVAFGLQIVGEQVPADLAATIASLASSAPDPVAGAGETPFDAAQRLLAHVVEAVLDAPAASPFPDVTAEQREAARLPGPEPLPVPSSPRRTEHMAASNDQHEFDPSALTIEPTPIPLDERVGDFAPEPDADTADDADDVDDDVAIPLAEAAEVLDDWSEPAIPPGRPNLAAVPDTTADDDDTDGDDGDDGDHDPAADTDTASDQADDGDTSYSMTSPAHANEHLSSVNDPADPEPAPLSESSYGLTGRTGLTSVSDDGTLAPTADDDDADEEPPEKKSLGLPTLGIEADDWFRD